jgi:hypothetical protein
LSWPANVSVDAGSGGSDEGKFTPGFKAAAFGFLVAHELGEMVATATEHAKPEIEAAGRALRRAA